MDLQTGGQQPSNRGESDQNANSRGVEATAGSRRVTNARHRGGGSKHWRGAANSSGHRPRVRTESWPAVSNGGQQSAFQSERTAPINVQSAVGRHGGTYQSWRGRGAAMRQPAAESLSVRNFDRPPPTGPNGMFTSFSYTGPPPSIMEPRFYFEAENWRPYFSQMPPPLYALNPVHPAVVRPMHQQQRAPSILRGNDLVRQLENPFSTLKLHKPEEGEAISPKSGAGDRRETRYESIAIPSLLSRRELGLVSRENMRRRVTEVRVREGGKKADGSATTVKKILEEYPGESLRRCQFMEATPDGKNIFGSWALRDRDWSRIMCARVDADGRNVGERQYGIRLTPSDNYIYVMDKNVVDLCRARVDNMVTCVLYVTVPSQEPRGSRIFLQPVPELSVTDDQSRMTTPIYNAHWALSEDVLSCAWDFTKMRLSVGLERYGMIVDVVSETDFKLFSCHKNVLAQRFSKDGSLLFMGVRDSSILCCDLRRQFHHAVYALPQSSACWLYLMSDANYLIAADFSGQIKLWDLRTQRTLRSFDGQSNSQTKLPVVVDEQDSLIFAVGDNGTTSGWSLKTGRLLRQIPCPYPVTDGQDLPRVCYSGCWGGVAGNAAVVLGTRDEAHFYELQL